MLIQVVKHFACHTCRQLSLREGWIFNQLFDSWDVVGDLVPVEVYNLVELA